MKYIINLCFIILSLPFSHLATGQGITLDHLASIHGSEIRIDDVSGTTHTHIQPDNDSTGGFFQVSKGVGASAGFIVDGNHNGSEEPLVKFSGLSTIILRPGSVDDASVILPNNALNTTELMNETGVANATSNTTSDLTSSYAPILQRMISAPSAGYVLAIGSCQLGAIHIKGTRTSIAIGVSNSSVSVSSAQDVGYIFPADHGSGVNRVPASVHGLFAVTPGFNTFYLLGKEFSGEGQAFDKNLTLLFIPTAYGSTTENVSDGVTNARFVDDQGPKSSGLTDKEVRSNQAASMAENTRRMEAELAAMKKEVKQLQMEKTNAQKQD